MSGARTIQERDKTMEPALAIRPRVIFVTPRSQDVLSRTIYERLDCTDSNNANGEMSRIPPSLALAQEEIAEASRSPYVHLFISSDNEEEILQTVVDEHESIFSRQPPVESFPLLCNAFLMFFRDCPSKYPQLLHYFTRKWRYHRHYPLSRAWM